MLSTLFDFGIAALVMAAWVAVAFVVAFIGFFLTDLIGERIYGRNGNRRN